MAIIATSDLKKCFTSGGRKNRRLIEAVSGLTFSIDAGERIAFIGPNGAGKSTSIKMLTGILHPTSGSANVLGLVPWQQRRQLTKRIGTLFGQRSQLWQEVTARRSLQLLATIYGLDRSAAKVRIEQLAELLDAQDLFDQSARTFSLGQRMRCELAAAMLHRPEILFLDEPTIGLDLVAKQTFRELIARLNEEDNTTIFLTSHDVADIEAVAQRVIIVNHGRIIYDDSVASLRSSLLSVKLIDINLEHEAEVRLPDYVEAISVSPLAISLRVNTRHISIRNVLDHILDTSPVADISITDPPLEEVIGGIYTGELS
jgi:ABC-2 type transport system ATP-binding protein